MKNGLCGEVKKQKVEYLIRLFIFKFCAEKVTHLEPQIDIESLCNRVNFFALWIKSQNIKINQ